MDKPKPQPKPDPATVATSPNEIAKKRQELRSRTRGGFVSQFTDIKAPTGGGNQTLG